MGLNKNLFRGLAFSLVFLLMHAASVGSQGTRVEDLMKQAGNLRKEAQENPKNVTAHIMLGIVLQELHMIKPDGGRGVPEAEKAYRTALELPLEPNVRLLTLGNLGVLYMTTSKIEEALQYIDQGLHLADKNAMERKSVVGLLFNRSKALAMLGDMEDSQRSYLATIEAARLHDYSSYAKSLAAMQFLPDSLINEIECATTHIHGDKQRMNCSLSAEFLEWIKNMPDIDRSWMFFGLSKALSTSAPDPAWKYLKEANVIQKTMSEPYDRQAEDRGIKAIQGIFSKPIFEAPTGFDDPTPIFIVGLPRSGSTLVEQLLASHSEVLAIGEDTPFAPIVGELMDALSEQGVNHQKVLKDAGAKAVFAMRALAPSDFPSPARIVDKMLRNVWNVGYMHLILPKACIIHAARHPLDAGLSCYAQPFEGRGTRWAWDLVDIGHQYKVLHSLLKHWDSVLPQRILRVHYELLVSNFEEEARRIVRHCGLEWQDSILQFHKTKRPVSTASMEQVRRELYTSSVGRWKQFKDFLGPLKDELGDLITEYDESLEQARGTYYSVQDEL